MDKTNLPGEDRTVKRESGDEIEHLIPAKIAKLADGGEGGDNEQKNELQKIKERLSQAVDDVNIDLIETILKDLQSDDVRRLQDVIISLTCQSLERGSLQLVKCLFNNIIILQSDGQLDINLNIQLITCAIKSDFVEGIQYLYSKKLYLEVEHGDKVWSALLASVKYNSFNITKYILTISDLNLNPDSRETLLMFAKSGQMLSILLSNDQIKNMINYESESGHTALYQCIENTDNVAECLNCINILTEAGAEFDKSNLINLLEHVISTYGENDTCRDIIISLLQHGADINTGDWDTTPLICAIKYHGDKDTCVGIVSLLLQHGADVNPVDGYNSPLTCAIEEHGDKDTCVGIVSVLLQHGADVNLVDWRGISPLTYAIINHGDKDTCKGIISLLLQHGADVNHLVNRFNSPLRYIIGDKNRCISPLKYTIYHYGDKDTCVGIVSLLLQHGADVKQVDGCNSLLTCAIMHHGDNDTCVGIVSVLLQHGADVNLIDMLDISPLTCAIINYGDKDTCRAIISLLLQHGADVNQLVNTFNSPFAYYKDFFHGDKDCISPLAYTIYKHGDKDTCVGIVSLLLQHGADVNLVESYYSPLSRAIKYHGDKDTCVGIVSLLLQHGVNVNQDDIMGYTPLTCAIEYHGDKDTCVGIVSLFLQHGANVNLVDGYGCSPLTRAILQHGDKDTFRGIVSLLHQYGADVNLADEDGISPLTCAIKYRGNKDTCVGIVSLLLQYGADVNLVLGFNSPLTCAILEHGDKDTCRDIVSLLLQYGADANLVDRNDSPLSCAIRYHGADVKLVDKNKSPLTCAIRHHGDKNTWRGIVTLLIQHGADPTQSVNTTTPLMYAAQYAHYIDIVKLVLVDTVNLNRTDSQGLSACRRCFVKQTMENIFDRPWVSKRDSKTTLTIFKLLVESGANLDANGPELLYDIMKFGQLNIFEYYIGLKPLVDSFTKPRNQNIFHPLAQVKYEFTREKFNWLFDYNIDINHKDSLTNTPLIIGAFLLNHKYLDLITNYSPSCDVNIQNNKGHTAIHSAVVGCLLSKSRLKHTGNSVDDTLHEQYETFQECVKLLLDAGGNINSQDNNGKTALILAAKKNNKFIIRLLLDMGSNINILETKYDTSALQYLDLDYSRHFVKMFLMRGGHKLLNLPGPDGNTLIQRALLFPTCSEPEKTVDIIRYLVAENCCLQHLQSVSTERNYYNDDVHLDDFNSEERDELRLLLYRSGAPAEEIVSTVNFKMENERDGQGGMVHSEHREKFKLACFNLSLQEMCVRLIRQKLGLEIKEKVEQLELTRPVVRKILLVDLLPKKYFIRYSMDDYYYNMGDDDDDDDDDYDDDDDDDDDTGFLASDSDFNGYDYHIYNLDGNKDDTPDIKNNVVIDDDDDGIPDDVVMDVSDGDDIPDEVVKDTDVSDGDGNMDVEG